MKTSTKIFVFKVYYLILTYVYVSSWLLSSDNIRGTVSYEWGSQLDSNSLV